MKCDCCLFELFLQAQNEGELMSWDGTLAEASDANANYFFDTGWIALHLIDDQLNWFIVFGVFQFWFSFSDSPGNKYTILLVMSRERSSRILPLNCVRINRDLVWIVCWFVFVGNFRRTLFLSSWRNEFEIIASCSVFVYHATKQLQRSWYWHCMNIREYYSRIITIRSWVQLTRCLFDLIEILWTLSVNLKEIEVKVQVELESLHYRLSTIKTMLIVSIRSFIWIHNYLSA